MDYVPPVPEIRWEDCLIWNTQAKVEYHGNDSYKVHSPRAGGTYIIGGTQTATVKNLDDAKRALLTSRLVRDRIMGESEPRVPFQLAKGLSHLSIHERADSLLKYIESELSDIGDLFVFETNSNARYPQLESSDWRRYAEMLAWSESSRLEELMYLLEYLQIRAWLERTQPKGMTLFVFSVTVAGYSHLAELRQRISDSSQAFVAMWFDPSLDDAWEVGIEPAIEDAGYTALRIDKKEHMNRIDDEIIAEIRRSKFLVADFTEGDSGARGGVYYEAGFAHGLNIPVIFTCRKDSLEKVHFDTRQYAHIVWSNPEELRPLLARRISAVLGDGPKKAEAADSH